MFIPPLLKHFEHATLDLTTHSQHNTNSNLTNMLSTMNGATYLQNISQTIQVIIEFLGKKFIASYKLRHLVLDKSTLFFMSQPME